MLMRPDLAAALISCSTAALTQLVRPPLLGRLRARQWPIGADRQCSRWRQSRFRL